MTPLVIPWRGPAVFHGDDDVLRHVGQLAGQVAGVGRLQGGVGQPLAGPVGGGEVLQHAEAFAEVGLDRGLDDLARGLGHQAPHPGELADLLDAAAGAGVGHQEDRVEVDLAVADVVLQLLHHLRGDPLAGVGPGVEDLGVALVVGDDPALVELVVLGDLLLGLGQDRVLGGRGLEVVGGEGQARPGRLAEAQVLHVVQEVDRLGPAQDLVAVGDDPLELLLPQRVIVERHLRVEDVVEDHAADGGLTTEPRG